MQKSIIIIGCFDTKGPAFAFLRDCLLARGESVLTINTGMMETAVDFPIDYDAEVVAEAANDSLARLRTSRDRGRAIEVIGTGAASIVTQLVRSDRVKGAIGMGGGGGTFVALAAMQPIPFGIPKLCLSTMTGKDLTRQVGTKDVTLMASVVDVAGLNGMLRPLIEQAAATICAMANVTPTTYHKSAGRIAISMFGNTTACVSHCTERLEKLGYEVIAFHANGLGGRAMESLIAEGHFDAVLDVTTTELADELCGGVCSAGPDRLTAASQMGLPQVVAPGCLDMVNFSQPDTVPTHYLHRQLYNWTPTVTLLRTNELENEQLGKLLAQKVNRSKADVTVVLPLNGVSQIDAVGNDFYKPEVNKLLFDAIKSNLSERVRVIESPTHINDPAFADVLVTSLLELLQRK
ncbi:Tm-1-like ATP-binding domain-containing protein [Spirosoma sp. BT702]|uniref:Tm-1-like ATP-binding domain-containing protein n=1 Tax=Spirosoma profusum TaxID=2771354 RepID=A0A926Y4S6_9BACT|nr:Tm-1-like ATP-binding domain-containing protein [Spirosoma profusum]MBD2703551.1 Tm-1-like ATP-binding domain-containing protein [Spirosoma profusum]